MIINHRLLTDRRMQYFPRFVCPSKVHALHYNLICPQLHSLTDRRIKLSLHSSVRQESKRGVCNIYQYLTLTQHSIHTHIYYLLLLCHCHNNLPLGVVVVAALVVVVVVVAQRQYPSTLPHN